MFSFHGLIFSHSPTLMLFHMKAVKQVRPLVFSLQQMWQQQMVQLCFPELDVSVRHGCCPWCWQPGRYNHCCFIKVPFIFIWGVHSYEDVTVVLRTKQHFNKRLYFSFGLLHEAVLRTGKLANQKGTGAEDPLWLANCLLSNPIENRSD